MRDDAVIQAGEFLPGGRHLVTRHDRASLGVWSVATGALLAFFATDSPIYAIAPGSALGGLAVGVQSGALHFLALPLAGAAREAARLSRLSLSAGALSHTLYAAPSALLSQFLWPLPGSASAALELVPEEGFRALDHSGPPCCKQRTRNVRFKTAGRAVLTRA